MGFDDVCMFAIFCLPSPSRSARITSLPTSPRPQTGKLAMGKVVTGTVRCVAPDHAIVDLDDGAEGLLHSNFVTKSPLSSLVDILQGGMRIEVRHP